MPRSNDIIFVYITNPNRKIAKKMAEILVKKNLVACVNMFPISSLYRWNKKLTDEKEYVLLGKTLDKFYGDIVRIMEKQHPYKTPCIIKIPVKSNNKYFHWIKGEVDKSG